jgi:hypothetical protein
MPAIHLESGLSDAERRASLYSGDVFLYLPCPPAVELVRLAASMAEEAFAPRDPQQAQFDMPVAEYEALLRELKPAFIHHPRTMEIIRDMLINFGCDPEATYSDFPRLRTSTSGGYLTTGIAYAFRPHRDTWYSSPQCQVNWWLPVFPLSDDNGLGFHPQYWSKPVKNNSRHFNYSKWDHDGRPRVEPNPEEDVDVSDEYRPIVAPGGVILFSGSQLHSSVPNTSGRTRFSIDIRVVNIDDVREHRGAPNVDSAARGTNMRDFMRLSDFSHVPSDLVEEYDLPDYAEV